MYAKFKDQYPNVKIWFSKFTELRPKNCLLAGINGTQSVVLARKLNTSKL